MKEHEEFKRLANKELKRIVPMFECLEDQAFYVGDNNNIMGDYGIWHSKDGIPGYYVGNFTTIEDLKTDIDYLLNEYPHKIIGDTWVRALFTEARWHRLGL